MTTKRNGVSWEAPSQKEDIREKMNKIAMKRGAYLNQCINMDSFVMTFMQNVNNKGP